MKKIVAIFMIIVIMIMAIGVVFEALKTGSTQKQTTYKIQELKKENANLSFEADIDDTKVISGTGPFDANDNAGNDQSASNKVVRTFDTITYPLSVTINSKNAEELKNIKLKITGTLDNGITNNNRLNAKFADGGTENLETGEVSFEMEYTLSQAGAAVSIPIIVEVQGASNGLELKPTIDVQVISIDEENVEAEDLKIEFTTITPVKVSGKVNIQIVMSAGYVGGTGLASLPYKTYDTSASASDKSSIMVSALTFLVKNLDGRTNMKGATFPDGEIKFHFESTGSVEWGDGSASQSLNFSTKDTPLKLFDHQYVDYEQTKIPNVNTESYNKGIVSYIDTRTAYAGTVGSYIPKEKWETDEIGDYTINRVWDSGEYLFESEGLINSTRLKQNFSLNDYVIGKTFPTYRFRTTNTQVFDINQKAFSVVRMMYHAPNEYTIGGKNNPEGKANNVKYNMKIVVDSYEDENGIPFVYPAGEEPTATATIYEVNNPDGQYALQNTFHSIAGMELGTKYDGDSRTSKGDPQAIIGDDVRMVSSLRVRAIAPGGLKYVNKWNIDSFTLTKAYATEAEASILNNGYINEFGETVKNNKTKQKVLYGVPKNTDMSFDKLTKYDERDYTWYTTYDAAALAGKVGAMMIDIQDSVADSLTALIKLQVDTRELGSINEKGTPNIIGTTAVIYRDAERTSEYRVREDGTYDNYTEYDSDGKITKIQSPVGSTINFETLGIINGEATTEIATDKGTYYSSETVKITTNSSLMISQVADLSNLDTTVKIRVKIPLGLEYVPETGKYGDDYVEPQIVKEVDGTYLYWGVEVSKTNSILKQVTFDAKVDPTNLGAGTQTTLTVESFVETEIDTRADVFKTSTKNIVIAKISMVGIKETINKVEGGKDSSYIVTVQPFTTEQDETNIKLLTHIPTNTDGIGSNFSGTASLKQIATDNPNNKDIKIYLNNDYIDVPNPNTINTSSGGWYEYTGAEELTDVHSIILFVNGSLKSTDTLKMNLEIQTNDNTYGDIYYNESILNSIADYSTSPASTRVRYLIRVPSKVIVHHYYEGTTNKVIEDITINGEAGDAYTTSKVPADQIDYKKYEVVSRTSNYEGTMIEQTIEVIYEYGETVPEVPTNVIEKDAQKYISTKGSAISYKIEYSAKVNKYVGDVLITIVDYLPYEIDESKSNLNGGIYDNSAKTITWQETIEDIDTFDNGEEEISRTKNISLVYKDIDENAEKIINKTQGHITLYNPEKTFDSNEDTGETIINYIDLKVEKIWADSSNANQKRPDSIKIVVRNDGNIVKEQILDETYGWEHTFENLPKYDETTEEEIVYIVDEEEMTLEDLRYYTKTINDTNMLDQKITNTYSNKEGKVIINHYYEGTTNALVPSEEIKGDVGESYTTKASEELIAEKYELVAIPDNSEGSITEAYVIVNYYYRKRPAKVIVEHREIITRKELADKETLNGFVSENYVTNEKDIAYYTLEKEPDNSKGKYKKEDQIVIYYYRPKLFNVAVEKRVTKLIVDGEEISSIGDGKFNKVDLHRKNVSGTNIEVQYEIVVRNTGAIAGSFVIKDVTPEGMQVKNKGEFEESGGILTKQESLNPGEEKSYKIVLRWNGEISEVGLKTNTVRLTNITNEAGFKETKEDDNESKAEILITIRTGLDALSESQRELFWIGIQIIAIVLVITIYRARKRKK